MSINLKKYKRSGNFRRKLKRNYDAMKKCNMNDNVNESGNHQ